MECVLLRLHMCDLLHVSILWHIVLCVCVCGGGGGGSGVYRLLAWDVLLQWWYVHLSLPPL